MKLYWIIFFLGGTIGLYGQSAEEICPLKVGTEVPSVMIKDKSAKEHDIQHIIGDKPTVIIFYRGAWCGYCTKHLAELNEYKADIESLGYQILGISLDQPSKLEESTDRSKSEILVYSDGEAIATKAFGLHWKVGDKLYAKYKEKYKLDLEEWSGNKHHLLPVPAIFIVKEGVIQFQYVNPKYSTRLKATTLLAILKTL